MRSLIKVCGLLAVFMLSDVIMGQEPPSPSPSQSPSSAMSTSPSPSPSPMDTMMPDPMTNTPSPTPTMASPTPTMAMQTPTRSPSPSPAEDEPVCFPGDATVELEDGSNKMMRDVQLGDSVKVDEGLYSEVFMFTHRMKEVKSRFVRIETAAGPVVRLTSGHYLHVGGMLKAAKEVEVGDTLMVAGKETPVKRVDWVYGEGLFNPQTVHGDIVVNGIKASTYTTAVDPMFAHSILSPFRALYGVFGWSTSMLDSGSDILAGLAPKGQAVY